MKEQSLHQIMNKMVQRLDVIQPADQKSRMAVALSELDAFIHIDSLLASLNKEYLEAKAQRKELSRLNGADDAMTEIALDMEDSAWCAMQTRYIELRQKGKLMERAQCMVRRSEIAEKESIENEIKRDKEKALKQFMYFAQILERVKEMNKAPDIFAWMVYMLFFNNERLDYKKSFNHAIAA